MRARVARTVLAIACLGCTSYAQRVEEVRASAVGLRARELRHCLPVPVDTQQEGDTEWILYRWEPEPELGRSVVVTTTPREPEPWTRRPERRDPLEDAAARSEPRPPAPYCELIVETYKERVRSVQGEGRNENGLNSSGRCIMQLERCLPRN